MKILEYFCADNKSYWLEQIGKSDWSAGKYLHELLAEGRFRELCGSESEVLLLTEGESLLSFCTFSMQDDIDAPELFPWVGFVYTFPEYRGKRCAGKLIEYAYCLAKSRKYEHIYLSTEEIGLYEKYGFTFRKTLPDIHGKPSRVYTIDVTKVDYSTILGSVVCGTVDRPLGSRHPKHPYIVYPVNYGYVDGVFAGDGAEQDVYILGSDTPLDRFEGKVMAVYHRLNDIEDKWIVSMDSKEYTRTQILRAIEFQEQYFVGELYM